MLIGKLLQHGIKSLQFCLQRNPPRGEQAKRARRASIAEQHAAATSRPSALATRKA